jgi:hypothetical protein
LFVTFVTTSSCNEDVELTVNGEVDITKDVKVYLSFDSSDEIYTLLQSEDAVPTRSIGNLDKRFVSLLDYKPETTRSSESEDYYVLSGYDTLVPNEKLAALLNSRGEIRVGQMLYRVTPEGTYFFNPLLQDYVDASISSFAGVQGEEISEGLYQIEENVFRYNTFPQQAEHELEFEGICYDGDILDDEEDEPESRTVSERVVPIATFSSYNVKGKTFLGKLISAAFGGSSKYEHEFIKKKRRMQGSFYDYNYGFYSEVGIFGEMQKKNWIGWSGTKADEIVIGWSNLILETDLKVSGAPVMPRTPTVVGSTNTVMPGLRKNGICMTILGLDVTNKDFQTALKAGLPALLNWLRRNVSGNVDHADALAVITSRKLTYIVPKQELRYGDIEKKRIVFASDFHMVFSFGSTSSEYYKWIQKTAEESMKVPVMHIKSGEVYVAGRIGEQWGGVKISQK